MKSFKLRYFSLYLILLLSFLLLSLMPFLPNLAMAKEATDKKKITILKNASITHNALVSGMVETNEKSIVFKGRFQVTAPAEKIAISWFSANQKEFKPHFKSLFKTDAPTLFKGQKLFIKGDFKKLIKALFDNKKNGDDLEAETGISEDTGDTAISSSDSSATTEDTTAASGSDSGTQPTSTPGSQNPTTPAADDKTVSGTTTESCPHEIAGSQIHLKTKTVTTYSDGSTEESACSTSATYDLINTYDDCSPRHDFVNARTHLQQKTGYVNDEGNFIMTKSCHDTGTTYLHQKTSASCDQHFDQSKNLIYQSKKTYYTDVNGNMHIISECMIDANDFKSVSPDDYLLEYSNADRVELSSKMAFKRFKYYIQLGDKKVYVSDWQDDLTSPMAIYKDFESCSYFHDISAAISSRQYQWVYDRDGVKKPVSGCKADTSLSFSHITDEKFCTPDVINRQIYKKVSTYFLDETGKRVVVSDCSLTDEIQTIDPAYVKKNYDKCKPRIDFSQMKAVAAYVEEISIGTQIKEISTCTEDPSVTYLISESGAGCDYRIDTLGGVAVMQKRLVYNNGSEDVFVSECKDSAVTSPLLKSAAACLPQVSGDQLVEYQQTHYINSNGDKKVVVACSPTDNFLPITEDMKTYDYDACSDHIDLADMKANPRFKTHVDIMGNKTLLKSCQIDSFTSYPIVETEVDCGLRHDFSAGISHVQARLRYTNRSGEEVDVKGCYDTAKTYNHQKMVSTCSPVYDRENNVTYDTKKTYYTDGSGNLVFITGCMMDTSTSQAVLSADIKKEFTSTDYIDFDAQLAYKQYREFIVLGGDQKEYVSAVKLDSENPMIIKKEYDSCDFYHDSIAGRSYRQFQEVYYRDGVRKVVSDCQQDTTKSFAHITDSQYCIPKIQSKIVYTKESTYFLDETSQRIVVKACELNGSTETLDPSLIDKDYSVCSPRIDLTHSVAIAAYKEKVTFDETEKFLSDCIEDTSRTYPITQTTSGCSYRVDLNDEKAYQQKRLFYNNGLEDVFLTACQDSVFEYPFVKSSDVCAPSITDDGTYFNEREETYFIDGSGVKRTIIKCTENGNTFEIPEDSKFKDFTKCEPAIVVEEMAAYGRFETYAKAGGENVKIQDCTVDPSVIYAIDEDYASCPVKIDPVSGTAIQYKKLFYRKGNEDVFVSACIASDTSYPIQKTVTGCDYRIDMANLTAIQQKRDFYDSGGSLHYTTECYDTDISTPIIQSDEFCPEQLSSNGLFLVEEMASYFINADGDKKVVQECTPTGIQRPVPDSKKVRNYDHCDPVLDMTTKVANRQYQTFVNHGNDSVMIEGCMPDFATDYQMHEDFSQCEPKIDLVNDEVIETSKWFYTDGFDDVYVTPCIESDTIYPIHSRTDICEVLEIDNDPNNVIQQSRLYYEDSQGNLQYITPCQATGNNLAVSRPVCSSSQTAGSARYIHNFPAGQSYIAVKTKYGSQVIENCHISENHAAMTHYEETCGWSHDNSKFRSTLKVRTYIKDAITNNKVYLDSCHASPTYVSYAYMGLVNISGENGGNPNNCGAGLYWNGSFSDNKTAWWHDGSDWHAVSYRYSLSQFQSMSWTAFKSGNYIGVFHHYVRPDNTNYHVWVKNFCGIKSASYMSGDPYVSEFSAKNPLCDGMQKVNSQIGSANLFGSNLGWSPQ